MSPLLCGVLSQVLNVPVRYVYLVKYFPAPDSYLECYLALTQESVFIISRADTLDTNLNCVPYQNIHRVYDDKSKPGVLMIVTKDSKKEFKILCPFIPSILLNLRTCWETNCILQEQRVMYSPFALLTQYL